MEQIEMQLINTLSDTPIQKFSFKSVDTRENIDFTLRYMPTQRSWYLDFTYNNQEFNGNKVVLGENILRMYKNIIPIGVSIIAVCRLGGMKCNPTIKFFNYIYAIFFNSC